MTSKQIDYALKRIFNAFKRNKNSIYKEDIESLKNLSDFFENRDSEIALNDIVFVKCISLLMFHYSISSGNPKTAISLLKKDLQTPLNYHISRLTLQLNNQSINNYLKSIGIEKPIAEDESELIKANEKEIIEKLKTEWSIKDITQSIYKTANDLRFNDLANGL